jgi:hypothetical protein
MVGPPLRQRRASRWCRLRRFNAVGWHVQALCVDGGTFARLGLADTGFGPL